MKIYVVMLLDMFVEEAQVIMKSFVYTDIKLAFEKYEGLTRMYVEQFEKSVRDFDFEELRDEKEIEREFNIWDKNNYLGNFVTLMLKEAEVDKV